MKILITYVSAGAGHFKAAEAIKNYIKKNCPEVEIDCIDILERATGIFRAVYRRGYSLLVKRAIFLWRFFYFITSFKPFSNNSKWLFSIWNRLNLKDFIDLLVRKNPNYIISTHFLPSEIVSNLKSKSLISSKLLTVTTDFSVHPFWVQPNTDFYAVACGKTKNELISLGAEEGKIKETGIPVDAKFLNSPKDKNHARRSLGLVTDKFTVLLVTGSFGIGPLKEIAEMLCNDMQVLVVCAANKKLFKQMERINLTNTKIFGYVNNIELLMEASDIIITKPGGLTISELLSMELPPIFISAIPGQEEANIEVLSKYGIGLSFKSLADLKSAVLNLKNTPLEINKIKANIQKIKHANSAKEICDVVCKDSSRPAC